MHNIYIKIITTFIVLTFSACGQNAQIKKDMKTGNEKDSIQKTENEWKKQLSEQQYYVLRQKGTETPFSGKLLLNKEKGIYKCAACGNELFTDKMKFDSHCGWPSFDNEIRGGKIKTVEDTSQGMKRIEIMCARCGGHLGHLFDDGTTETGLRYCVNSLSLEFVNENDLIPSKTNEVSTIDTITIGGGCYWCVEAIYEKLIGIKSVVSGFSGGTVKNPSYQEICTGKTGHAEVIQITFDNARTSLDEIFKVFFTVHDPTTLNRQGADIGTQYRSVIFYRNDEQYKTAKEIIDTLNEGHIFNKPIVTQLEPFKIFYKAEDYHQDYYNNHKEEPYCKLVITPKLEKFEKIFKNRLK